MSSFKDDFNYVWNKPDNGLMRIIIINVTIFFIVNLGWLFTGDMSTISQFLRIPSDPYAFLMKPWTLFTHFFTHSGFWHIFWNLIVLYWFGQLFVSFSGNRRMIALYILGGLAGGIAYFTLANTIPFFEARAGVGALGASAAVNAIIVGAATLMPDYRVHLFLIGPAKLKYIALVVVILAIFGIRGANTGGEVAHLGGALMGFLFVRQLRNGSDWSTPVLNVLDWFSNLTKPKSKLKVSYRNNKKSKKKKGGSKDKDNTPDQNSVDRILDKISESGYEKLSEEEKQILFRASQKKGQN
ncbi:MAG: rhomboid family intramembrane serine protease [Flammeovirgaceae bacterium]